MSNPPIAIATDENPVVPCSLEWLLAAESECSAWACEGEWASPAEITNAIRTGTAWPATMDAYRTASATLPDIQTPGLVGMRRRRIYDESGADEPDIARALGGDVCWTRMTKGKGKPRVHVAIVMNMSGMNGAEDFRKNITIAVGVCDALTRSGYDVMITGMCAGRPSGGKQDDKFRALEWPLKEYGEPLQEEKMLAYGTPGFCRGFVLMQRDRFFGCEGMSCRPWDAKDRARVKADIIVAAFANGSNTAEQSILNLVQEFSQSR